MLDSKMDVLVGILGTFGLLMFIVFGVIIMSALKKRPQDEGLEDKTQWQLPQETETSQQSPDLIPRGKPPEVLVPVGAETQSERQKLSRALHSTKDSFWGRIQGLFKEQDSPELEALEEVLYTSDLGPKTVQRLLDIAEPELKKGIDQVKSKLKMEISEIFSEAHVSEPDESNPLKHLQMTTLPSVWMIVGINGAGKTTTIGKMAALLAGQGKKVLVAAGDTFRAAAGAQLKVWTERAEAAADGGSVEIFHPEGVSDPSAVAFDAVTKAKARNYEVVLIDTAGRLHNQSHLMDELKKVKRVIQKVIAEAPHETLLVLDANNGQNALNQAREFHQTIQISGVVLTKMDGTAKGGVAVGVAHELKVPIRLLGLGEKVGDLRPFSASGFVDSILG